jgi:hypothetical protein
VQLASPSSRYWQSQIWVLISVSRVAPTTPLPVFQRSQIMSLAGGGRMSILDKASDTLIAPVPAGRSERVRASLTVLLRLRCY